MEDLRALQREKHLGLKMGSVTAVPLAGVKVESLANQRVVWTDEHSVDYLAGRWVELTAAV